MNFNQIRGTVYLNTQDKAGKRWPVDQYNNVVNEGYFEVCRDLRLPRDYDSMATVSGRQYIILPTYPAGKTADDRGQPVYTQLTKVLYDDDPVKITTVDEVHAHAGNTWDTNTGDPYLCWIQSEMDNTSYSITAANATNKTFAIAADWTQRFRPATKATVSGSTGKDGTYTVVSSTFSTTTVITVSETVANNTADGTLKCIYNYEQRLYFYPIPSGDTVKWWGVRRPQRMANSTDYPEIPTQYHDLIVTVATRRVWEVLGDQNKAMFYDGRYRRDLRNAIGELAGGGMGETILEVADY